MRKDKEIIPHPSYQSWMHERCHVPRMTLVQKRERWNNQPLGPRVLDSILSRMLVRGGLLRESFRPILYKMVAGAVHFYFKYQNHLKIKGLQNVPKRSALFYLNHPGSYDPLILMSALPMQVGGFVSWGNGWFMEMLEKAFGYISRNYHLTGKQMIEKMVRQVLSKNSFFAIWPEGHPTHHGFVKQGFSSVAKLYSVLNYDKNRIPLVPVIIRGSGIYLYEVKVKKGPIDIEFLESFYLPREWLETPENGGKTAREITDYMMNILARNLGQETFMINSRLENRRHKLSQHVR